MNESQLRGTYLLATLALMVAIPSAIYALVSSPGSTTYWTLSVSATIAAWMLEIEARRDPFVFAQYGASVLGVLAVVFVGGWVVTGTPRVPALVVAMGCALVAGFVACVRRIVRERHMKDVAPNLLLQQFGPGSLFERDGVQWTGVQGDPDLRQPSFVRFYFQNCVAAERRVRVSLNDEAGALRRGGGLRRPVVEPLVLAPGEVASLTIPVRAGPRQADSVAVYVTVRASGGAGARLRVFRARAPTGRISLLTQVVGALAGHLMWGGGVRFTFANPAPAPEDGPAFDPPAKETIWAMEPAASWTAPAGSTLSA